MNKLRETVKRIGVRNKKVMNQAQKRIDCLTKPQGSLGRLERIACHIAGITESLQCSVERKVVFILAADHGVAAQGVSAFPQEVTAQMVYNFIRAGAAINVLARCQGVKVVVADFGVAHEFGKELTPLYDKKIGWGTKNFMVEPAMSRQDAVRAIEAGIELFEQEFRQGIDLVGIGEMGIGNTTASSAIVACITEKPVEKVTGRGTGITNESLQDKINVIKNALALHLPDRADAIDILSKIGGYEIAGLTGIILASAAYRKPVVIDGFITGAAALLASVIEPNAREFMVASHCSVERGHKVTLDYLGLIPLFDLGLRLGEGTGAVLAMNIIEASIKIMQEMATFEQAQVSTQKEREKEFPTKVESTT